MALVHERAAQPSGSGVQVLVVAPDGEVGAGIVQGELQIPHPVGEIEPRHAPALMRRAGQRGRIERLAAEEVRRPDEEQRNRFVQVPDGILAARDLDQRIREAVERRLRSQGIAIGGEGALLEDDAVPLPGGSIEGDEQEVEVHRQRVHHHHFVRQRAGEARDRRGEQLVIRQPRPLSFVVALHAALSPVQLLEHVLARAARHEPQRMPREVQVDSVGEDEFVAQARQRVGRVLRARPAGAVARLGHARSSSEASSPSHSSALRASRSSRVRASSSIERMSAPGRSSPSGKG